MGIFCAMGGREPLVLFAQGTHDFLVDLDLGLSAEGLHPRLPDLAPLLLEELLFQLGARRFESLGIWEVTLEDFEDVDTPASGDRGAHPSGLPREGALPP